MSHESKEQNKNTTIRRISKKWEYDKIIIDQ